MSTGQGCENCPFHPGDAVTREGIDRPLVVIAVRSVRRDFKFSHYEIRAHDPDDQRFVTVGNADQFTAAEE